MAGSFGFESDKYDVSIAIGERRLLPAVRQAADSTVIMADGFSCREQICQQTERHALHLAEVIQMARRIGTNNGERPEAKLAASRKASRRNARWRAAAALALLAGGSCVLAKRLQDNTYIGEHNGKCNWSKRVGDRGRIHSQGKPRAFAADDQPRNRVPAQLLRPGRACGDHHLLQRP